MNYSLRWASTLSAFISSEIGKLFLDNLFLYTGCPKKMYSLFDRQLITYCLFGCPKKMCSLFDRQLITYCLFYFRYRYRQPFIMANAQLTFEEKKFILKCYWKHENIMEVQRQFNRQFQKTPPTRRTIARIKEKFEVHGTLHNCWTLSAVFGK